METQFTQGDCISPERSREKLNEYFQSLGIDKFTDIVNSCLIDLMHEMNIHTQRPLVVLPISIPTLSARLLANIAVAKVLGYTLILASFLNDTPHPTQPYKSHAMSLILPDLNIQIDRKQVEKLPTLGKLAKQVDGIGLIRIADAHAIEIAERLGDYCPFILGFSEIQKRCAIAVLTSMLQGSEVPYDPIIFLDDSSASFNKDENKIMIVFQRRGTIQIEVPFSSFEQPVKPGRYKIKASKLIESIRNSNLQLQTEHWPDFLYTTVIRMDWQSYYNKFPGYPGILFYLGILMRQTIFVSEDLPPGDDFTNAFISAIDNIKIKLSDNSTPEGLAAHEVAILYAPEEMLEEKDELLFSTMNPYIQIPPNIDAGILLTKIIEVLKQELDRDPELSFTELYQIALRQIYDAMQQER